MQQCEVLYLPNPTLKITQQCKILYSVVSGIMLLMSKYENSFLPSPVAQLPLQSVRDELGQIKTAAADLMNKIEGHIIKERELENWVTCDQLAVAWVIDDARNKWLENKGKEKNGALCGHACNLNF